MSDSKGVILNIVGWWPTGDVAGIFIREHIQAIARHAPVIVVFATRRKEMSWPRVEINRSMEEGLPVMRIVVRTPLRRFGFDRWLLRRALRKALRPLHAVDPFSLVHVHVRTWETEEALTIAKELRIPVVLTEHNSYYHLGILALPEPAQTRQRQRLRDWLADPVIKLIMPVSQNLARTLQDKYAVAKERIMVVPNVAAPEFQFSKAPDDGYYHIVTAANWRPPKDHDTFITALRSLSPESRQRCIIHWVGFGPAMEAIKTRCRTELVGMDVRFPGHLNKAGMARAMQHAHLFVLPTMSENLPCVVIESLCCGTPVVSMAVGGLPELVERSNGLLVTPSDPHALAEALADCIEGRFLFDRRAIAEAAQQRFSMERVGGSIDAVYDRVLGR